MALATWRAASAKAARALLREASKNVAGVGAARGSRNTVFTGGYLYFLVLESRHAELDTTIFPDRLSILGFSV